MWTAQVSNNPQQERPLRSQKDKDLPSVSQNETSIQDSIILFSRFKNNASSSNGATKAGTQLNGARQDESTSKGKEKMKGLHDCSFQDVRDISNSQSLLKNEASIHMNTPFLLRSVHVERWQPFL